MRAIRTLAVLSLAMLLASGLGGPRLSLAHHARDAAAGGSIFAGLVDGGVYRSDDGGSTWQEADAGLPVGQLAYALAVAPDGTTVYAATLHAGLWVSTNKGASWQADNGSTTGRIPADASLVGLAIDPLDGRHLVTASYQGSAYQSRDGGRIWAAQVLPTASAVRILALDPPATILVGTFGDGLLVSTDGGSTWHRPDRLGTGLRVYSLAVDPTNPDSAYLGAESALYRTADGGATWQWEAHAPHDTHGPLIVDPSGLAGVLSGGFDAISRSTDGGTSWQAAHLPITGGISAFAFDPARPARVLAGVTGGGLLVSTDSGTTWQDLPKPGADSNWVVCLASSPRIPLPSDPVAPPGDLPHMRYFPATFHTLASPFLAFWDRYGKVPVFGSPLTQPFTEDGQMVQYFERARLAYTDNQVVVSPLGAIYTAGRRFPQVAPFPSTATRLYFPDTGHSLAPPFLAYWRQHEGSLIIGPPISQPLREQNRDGSGRIYVVQYFRDMRLEYHTELAGTPYVSPGVIGRQYLHQRGWI